MEVENIEKYRIISYGELLKELEDSENHLLVGNGFNHGLGINTSYHAIFTEMIEKRMSVYKEVIDLASECNYDLEELIGKLTAQTESEFLKKFIANKIKLDFMEATQKIVKRSIKDIYAEKNEGVFMLLKNFTNYFTLNFDSFLYLLLLNFKEDKKNGTALGLTAGMKFIEEDLNSKEDMIYNEIKNLRNNGSLEIFLPEVTGGNHTSTPLSNITKSHFVHGVKQYATVNDKKWTVTEIERVVKYIWMEEKRNNVLNKVEDGFKNIPLFSDEYIYDNCDIEQNIFFLHGAFHIYVSGGDTRKITQTSDKALYTKLEEIINKDNHDILTIFQSSEKEAVIHDSEYLVNCLAKLETLEGSLILIGCSLSENDEHIFRYVNNSNLTNIYISYYKDANAVVNSARQHFPNKNIILFDAETISYSIL